MPRYHGSLLYIWSDYKSDAAVRVHVVSAVLGIVLDDKNQGVFGIFAVRDLLHDQSDGIIVIRHHGFYGVHAVFSLIKVSKMIMRQAQQLQVRQVIVLYELIELALPLLETPVIGKAHIEAAEVRIGDVLEPRVRRKGDANAGGSRIMQQRDGRPAFRRG